MKKWTFMAEVEDWGGLKSIIEEKAKELSDMLGSGSDRATYKVMATFYQKRDRWRKDDPSIPRQDWGVDLDNLLKPVLDGLGHIIGFRADFTGEREHSGVLDASIVEVHAKKVHSGSDKEFLGIEVELLHTA